MNRQQVQIQRLLEEILSESPETIVELFKETIRKMDRARLDALRGDALDSLDRDKLEKWLHEALNALDTDGLERWARQSLAAIDADKLARILRDKLGGLDKDKVEALLSEHISHIDRRKLEKRLHEQIQRLDLEKIKAAIRSRLNEVDPQRVERFFSARVDDLIRARLDALSAAELELLLEEKRATAKEIAAKETTAKAKVVAPSPTKTAPLKTAPNKEAKVVVAKERESNPLGSLLGAMGRFAFVSAAGWIAYSHYFLEHQVPLPKAIAAELLTLAFRPAGPLNSYQDRTGQGRPLVLIHSINAAASSYEMRPLFQHYRGQRPVFALDLPGFGFSARPNLVYAPNLYVEAILTLLADISGGPADVVALSLSGEFAAEAAHRRPELFHSLALISPSGMYHRDGTINSHNANEATKQSWLYPLLSMRLWARPFFDLLTTRRAIDYFLKPHFAGPIPEGMITYCYSTAHQPGAEHAPLCFVGGKLFTTNAMDRIYRQVTTPSLVLYDRDPYLKFDRLAELQAANDAWQSVRISPTLGLPHWEKLEETTAALENFWQGIKQPKSK